MDWWARSEIMNPLLISYIYIAEGHPKMVNKIYVVLWSLELEFYEDILYISPFYDTQ